MGRLWTTLEELVRDREVQATAPQLPLDVRGLLEDLRTIGVSEAQI